MSFHVLILSNFFQSNGIINLEVTFVLEKAKKQHRSVVSQNPRLTYTLFVASQNYQVRHCRDKLNKDIE